MVLKVHVDGYTHRFSKCQLPCRPRRLGPPQSRYSIGWWNNTRLRAPLRQWILEYHHFDSDDDSVIDFVMFCHCFDICCCDICRLCGLTMRIWNRQSIEYINKMKNKYGDKYFAETSHGVTEFLEAHDYSKRSALFVNDRAARLLFQGPCSPNERNYDISILEADPQWKI